MTEQISKPDVPQTEQTAEPKKKRKWCMGCIIVVAVLVLIIIVLIIAIIAGEKDEEKITDEKSEQESNIEESLGEQTRREIFKKISEAEDVALRKAEEEFNPDDFLKVGENYKLSESADLMPEVEPEDPLAALEKVKELSLGTEFEIIGKALTENGVIWYEVRVDDYGQGWFNSIALIDQFSAELTEQLNQSINYERGLVNQYKNEIMEKYGIDEEVMSGIIVEGVKNGW